MAIIIPNVAGQKERIEKQARQNMAQIIETQVNTYKLAENDSEVTVKELKTAGYLTDKQVEEAKKLLQLDENTTITLPINIPQPWCQVDQLARLALASGSRSWSWSCLASSCGAFPVCPWAIFWQNGAAVYSATN